MSKGFVIPTDPHTIANRFSSEDDPWNSWEDDDVDDDLGGFDEEGAFGVDTETAAALLPNNSVGQILELLDRIPQKEADLIRLYFLKDKRQADIASIFQITQAAVSYRLNRGLHRLQFLLSIPQITEEELQQDLPDVFPQQIDIDILIGMWDTTCQSEVAERLQLTQGRVRHRFFRAVDTLKEAATRDKRFQPYYEVFSAIASKGGKGGFNILREVRLPQWQDRGGDECS
jgi:DNA-directed RNA polymerase specialized sigma24 family protein